MPGLVAAPTTNTVAHGDRASHTQPGPTSFVIRRLNTSQLIQESELLLDDGQRHIHALRTIAPGVRATLYVEQAEDFARLLGFLKSQQPWSEAVPGEIKGITNNILRWRRTVQLVETSRWPSTNSVQTTGRISKDPRPPLGPSSSMNSPSRHPRTSIPRPPPPNSAAQAAPSLTRSLSRSSDDSTGFSDVQICCWGVSVSPVFWGANPAREVVDLVDLLPLSPSPFQIEQQLRLYGSSASTSTGSTSPGPPHSSKLSDHIAGVQPVSETSVVILFRETAEAVMLDNVWNLKPPPGYEGVSVQLVKVEAG